MAYVSLYRKYRPRNFSEVVGQKHVIAALTNALTSDSLHHAYLFAGPRGTGKTTIARILATAVNATGGPNPDFDLDDPVATDIRSGTAVDVIELDMASHGGVDDARDLRDRAMFSPVQLPKKVYILDEVHMASPAAFNALLKVIEEPPSHVLFAMATTDPQKIIPTILSRVQRFDLRRVAADELSAHITRIGEQEGFTFEPDALAMVLRAGDGSVRDTLSVVEQVVAFAGSDVTAAAVADVLGSAPLEVTRRMAGRIDAGDVAGLFGDVHDLQAAGHDLRRLTLDLVQHLRDLIVLSASNGDIRLVNAGEDERHALVTASQTMNRARLLRAANILADAVAEQRTGPQRLPLELALARAAAPGDDLDGLAARVASLEAGTAPAVTAPPAPPAPPAAPSPAPTPPPTATTAATPGPPAPVTAAPTDVAPEATAEPVSPVAEDNSPTADASVLPDDDAPPADDAGAVDDEPAAGDTAPAPGTPQGQASADAQPTPPLVDAIASAASDVDQSPGADNNHPTVPDESTDVDDMDLARIEASWATIIEVIGEGSKRVQAFVTQARPVRWQRRILTLQFDPKHQFHADQTAKPASLDVVTAAVGQVMGLTAFSVEAVVGDAPSRPPMPPPAESRSTTESRPTPSTGAGDAASATAPSASTTTDPAEQQPRDARVDVRETVAEQSAGAGQVTDIDDAVSLAVDVLDAQLID